MQRYRGQERRVCGKDLSSQMFKEVMILRIWQVENCGIVKLRSQRIIFSLDNIDMRIEELQNLQMTLKSWRIKIKVLKSFKKVNFFQNNRQILV